MTLLRPEEQSKRRRECCPACSRGRHDRTLGRLKCFRCGYRRNDEPVSLRASAPTDRPQDPEADQRNWAARRLLSEGLPLTGTLAETYLAARGIVGLDLEALPLRFLSRHRHCRSGQYWPAIIAPVVDPITNRLRTLHQTFLARDGSDKAPVDEPRLFLGTGAGGGVVKLSAHEDVTLGLGLAEGLETALAVMASGWAPVWACLHADNLGSFPVLGGIEALTLFADRDENRVGQRAADQTRRRWTAAGREAFTLLPDAGDWNDEVMRCGES